MRVCNHCDEEFHDTDYEKLDRHLENMHNISMKSEKQGTQYAVKTALRNVFYRDSSCEICNTILSNKYWYSEKLDAGLCKSCYDSLKKPNEVGKK